MHAGRGVICGCLLLAAACSEAGDAAPDRGLPVAGVGGAAASGAAAQSANPMAGAPAAGAPAAGAPVAGAPVAGAPVAGAPVAGAPMAGDAAGMDAPTGGVAGGDTPVAGMEGMAGAAGEPAVPGAVPSAQVPDPSFVTDCPEPPPGTAPEVVAALDAANAMRLPSGAGCASVSTAITTASQAHCDYYAQNSGACTADPHSEVASCAGFTGASPGARMEAAGYAGRGSSEVMAFVDDPQRAIDTWINSVWHRVPVLDPWTTELGYGHASGCDTVDFGRGTPAADDVIALYPFHGQLDVPTSFDGSREGPEPPAPPTGWPSASPITVYATDAVITEHLLTVEGDDTPIEHVWLTGDDSNFLRRSVMMYANAPFEAQTTYRVRVVGTYVGGPLELEWTFTTGDPPRFGR